MSGRVVPEFGQPNLREVFAYDYHILYRVEDASVLIVTVIHGYRKLEI